MEGLKTVSISYLLPVMAVLAVSFTYQHANGTNTLCNHRYALCTSALCVPQPGEPNKAICTCDVEEGLSMSTVPCDMIKPSTDSNGITTVYSTFSLSQFQNGKKGMKCPSETPWTWCLNKRCTVDPSNPKKAICTCDVVRNKGEWMTLGGDCNLSTCKTGYWSGASMKDFDSGNVFMTKAMGLEKSPVKWCQVSQ